MTDFYWYTQEHDVAPLVINQSLHLLALYRKWGQFLLYSYSASYFLFSFHLPLFPLVSLAEMLAFLTVVQ